MKMTNLTFEQRENVQRNNGLARYLESLVTGKPMTPRSWLYEDKTPDQVRDEWLNQLKVLDTNNAIHAEVFHFDVSQLEKWGPQGGVAPIADILEEIVLPSFTATPKAAKAFATPEWKQAKERVTRILKFHGCVGLRPASYERVYDDMRTRDVLESNSGWPMFTRRNKPEVKQQAIEAARNGDWKTYPAIILFRNYNQKTRPVWMYPMAVNLVEGSFFQPLQSVIMNSDILSSSFFAPWKGFESVKRVVSHQYANYGISLAASDFTKTDEHFRWEATREVFDTIAPCFNEANRSALFESLQYMHNIPLIVGPDSIIYGEHGVSSGSNWTNFVETIFDFILGTYVSILTADRVTGLYAIGDDMTWLVRGYDPELPKFLEDVGQSVNQVINASKTTNEKDRVKSLQRLFIRGYRVPFSSTDMLRGIYPTIRALKSLIYPERFHNPKKWSSDMFCARTFMILENCVDHPLFEEFVKFVCKGNKHLVPFAKQSKDALTRITGNAKLLPGLNPTYNQEKRDSSLATFESIRIASALS